MSRDVVCLEVGKGNSLTRFDWLCVNGQVITTLVMDGQVEEVTVGAIKLSTTRTTVVRVERAHTLLVTAF